MAVSITLIVIFGWATRWPFITQIIPSGPSMKPQTAFTYLAIAGALLAYSARHPALSRVLALFALTVGLTVLAEWCGFIGSDFDLWLFADAVLSEDTPHPGRMSPATAVASIILSLSLICLGQAFLQAASAQILAMITLLVGVVGCQFYLLDLNGRLLVDAFATVSIHNALVLIGLSSATLLCEPAAGPMSVVCSPRSGGRNARRLLPAILIILIVLGWVRITGQSIGFYDSEISAVLVMTTGFVGVAIGVWINARRQNQWEATFEAEQAQATQSLWQSEHRLNAIIHSAMDAILTFDENRRILDFNTAAERMFCCDIATAKQLSLDE
ncbi:MAG: PAS domain-containing protein, partial [Chthoniobacterales bacterium]